MKGSMTMIYLKINGGKGFFLNCQNEYKEIDTIRKDDILYLLDCATDVSITFEMDEFSGANIQNEAHKIIYEAIFQKFKELLNNKNRFLDESEALYKDALRKYKPETDIE